MSTQKSQPRITDERLIERLHALVGKDRRLTAQLLWHLAEVDHRGLHRQRGYSSLFNYCVEALHMSEAEAGLRIRVARTARRFPALFEPLQQGRLHLSAVGVLAPVLTEDNHGQLIAAAVHKTKAQVEELVADLRPKPACASGLRKLPAVPAVESSQGRTPDLFERTVSTEHSSTEPEPASKQSLAPRQEARSGSIAPLGQERFRIQVMADRQLRDQLKVAQDLMRHQVPDGDLAVIVGKAVSLLVAELQKKHFGKVGRPHATRKAQRPGSRHVPSHLRREVAERDGMRCTFVTADGHRCAQTGFLQFHHRVPFARGGPMTVDNLVLMCGPHNALLAEQDFGREHMAHFKRGQASNEAG